MTFLLNERYPNRVYAPSNEYPRGSFKNRTAPTSDDGTYLEEDWKNDERAFQEAILHNSGIVPNGNVDNALNSQVYEGLMKIVSEMIARGSQTLYGKATGGSDALSVTLPRNITLTDGIIIYVRAQYKNMTTSPTLKVGNLSAKAIVKGNNLPLGIGDIAGAGYVMHLTFDQNFDRWVLLNPALGVITPQTIPVGTLAYMGRNDEIDGWLKVDNREHQRSQYPELVQQCPQFVENGSTSATFRLKDLRGYFLRTLDNGKGVDTGRQFGSLQGDAIRNITGTFDANVNDGDSKKTGAFYNTHIYFSGSDGDKHGGVVGFDASRVVPTSNENRPKNYALPLYIKY